jgi:hypothetical protein
MNAFRKLTISSVKPRGAVTLIHGVTLIFEIFANILQDKNTTAKEQFAITAILTKVLYDSLRRPRVGKASLIGSLQ